MKQLLHISIIISVKDFQGFQILSAQQNPLRFFIELFLLRVQFIHCSLFKLFVSLFIFILGLLLLLLFAHNYLIYVVVATDCTICLKINSEKSLNCGIGIVDIPSECMDYIGATYMGRSDDIPGLKISPTPALDQNETQNKL